ncbi:hypothetical protein P1P75_03930 [Streptomyces sp. ID05-39B]|uniref:hypothetical protein n=1 Tax=Streptomyces sp. ID05-39B TaxID=3028664 RepID=UPI0029B4988D|nr:hypothetical protein [Streptomyces sp. ID05-39B]MDX3525601.1 hypothetical protein [Streptomyces sp. ID05-39B]
MGEQGARGGAGCGIGDHVLDHDLLPPIGSAVGGAVHLDDVVGGGIGTEGGEAFREAVADARVLGAIGRGQGGGELVEGQCEG